MTEAWPLWGAMAVLFAVVVIAFMAAEEEAAPDIPKSSFDI